MELRSLEKRHKFELEICQNQEISDFVQCKQINKCFFFNEKLTFKAGVYFANVIRNIYKYSKRIRSQQVRRMKKKAFTTQRR